MRPIGRKMFETLNCFQNRAVRIRFQSQRKRNQKKGFAVCRTFAVMIKRARNGHICHFALALKPTAQTIMYERPTPDDKWMAIAPAHLRAC
jgi:hypothetical protein